MKKPRNWRLAPPRANYWAQDESGLAGWHEEEPFEAFDEAGKGWWPQDGWWEQDAVSSYSGENPNWRESKERRPQPVIGMRWVERLGELIEIPVNPLEMPLRSSKEFRRSIKTVLQFQTEDGEWHDVPTGREGV